MKVKAFSVIDTNVLVSAMLSTETPPHNIFKMIEQGNIIPLFDKRILKEYYDVFNYEKFKNIISSDSLKNTLYTVVKNGIFVNNVEKTKEIFQDRKDIPFFEVRASSEEFNAMLVTGNIKHYPETEKNSVVTPRELINILNQMEFFVKLDYDYEKTVIDLIKTNTETDKYKEGVEISEELFDNEEEKNINYSYFDDIEL